jgi:transposase
MVRKKKHETESLWIATQELALPTTSTFYGKLEEVLETIKFGDQMRHLCAPYYSQEDAGRPPIDPEVYFKMLMIGFFENISSERGIAFRCADSLAVRSFLHYSLTENTPDHSSLSVIRKRLPEGIFGRMFSVVLAATKEHGLVKGKNIGLDTSFIEANASLKSLVNRMTEESYLEYIRALAEQEGLDPNNAAAVANFDRKRPDRKVSNDEWKNPHDEDAKIGKRKDGATDMLYRVEHAVDLDTGALVDVGIIAAEYGDTHDLIGRALNAQHRLNSLASDVLTGEPITTLTADKGYYDTDTISALRELGIIVNIPDKDIKRNLDKLDEVQRNAILSTAQFVTSDEGKLLLRRRGMHIERSFAHVLECGGGRKTMLRGREKNQKKEFAQGAFYNISLLMRKSFGIGTPRQFAASAYNFYISWYNMLYDVNKWLFDGMCRMVKRVSFYAQNNFLFSKWIVIPR